MLRKILLPVLTGAMLCAMSVAPRPAEARDTKAVKPVAEKHAAAKKKRPRVIVRRSSGYGPYGFLPGYTPPDLSDQRPRKTYHYWRGYDWDGWPVGSWGTGGYGGMWYRGRFSNGLGPCWSRTPIGPMWNCG
jgi:hypothetical protein